MKTASGAEWGVWETVQCAICGRERSDLLFETQDYIYGNEGRFRIVQCRDCRLVYLNPRPAPEEAWKFYPKQYYAYSHGRPVREAAPSAGFRSRVKRRVLEKEFGYPPFGEARRLDTLAGYILGPLLRARIASSTVPPYRGRHRLLDVGCGNGFFVQEMQGLGWESYGLEMNPEAARFAREERGLNVLTGRLPHAPLESGFFDVVTLCDSFEHMPNPGEVLREAHRILVPGGRLVVRTPDSDSIYRRVFRNRWFNVAAPLHYYLYNAQAISALLAAAGFRTDRIRYPRGNAGLLESLQIVLNGRVERNGNHLLAHPVIRKIFAGVHQIASSGHLLVHAVKTE